MIKKQGLNNLIIYREILNDTVIKKLQLLLETDSCDGIRRELTYDLIVRAEQLGLDGQVLKNYVLYLISRDENIFSILAEKNRGKIGNSLYEAAIQDFITLKNFLIGDYNDLIELKVLNNFEPSCPRINPSLAELKECFTNESTTPKQIADTVIDCYVRYGYGDMANYAAFRWDDNNGLIGVNDFDNVQLNDIVGYERQKEVLIKNIESFLCGKPANNVLLVGARGTGKSSSVKALVNSYFSSGLRLVEISKQQITSLYEIMNLLRDRSKKFIIFLDDLSFEDFEVEYKYLKSVIDGGVESKPSNVLIFATSNRRHIVRELWNDRNESTAELHRNDTLNEKISLSDRFGLTITFPQPDQNQYIKIVEEIAKKHKLNIPACDLQAAALKWELSHSGRSGRVAKQFVSHIIASSIENGKKGTG